MTGIIYFIGADEVEAVKIGYTSEDVGRRLTALQTGNPHKLRVLVTVIGNRWEEGQLHKRYHSSRLCGEWFKKSPPVNYLIETLVKNSHYDFHKEPACNGLLYGLGFLSRPKGSYCTRTGEVLAA